MHKLRVLLIFSETGPHFAALTALNLTGTTGWPPTYSSTYLCLKYARPHTQLFIHILNAITQDLLGLYSAN